jgi:pimeloyl-ACP methyl ester carboxylesterase
MFIHSGETKLYASSFGPSHFPAIVGIGGWIGSSELWLEPFSILSEYYRTIAYDHRGSGASIAPVESITLDNLVNDVFMVLDAYGIDQCTLAAESAGALTALAAALKNPQRITALIIVDGMYYQSSIQNSEAFLQGLKTNYFATLDRFVELCVPEPDCQHIKRWGRQIINRADQQSAVALHIASSGVDMRESLGQIKQPTLIIHGEQDSLVPLEHARELATKISLSQLVVLKGAGHVPTLTRPHEVATAISNFLSANF